MELINRLTTNHYKTCSVAVIFFFGALAFFQCLVLIAEYASSPVFSQVSPVDCLVVLGSPLILALQCYFMVSLVINFKTRLCDFVGSCVAAVYGGAYACFVALSGGHFFLLGGLIYLLVTSITVLWILVTHDKEYLAAECRFILLAGIPVAIFGSYFCATFI